MSVKKVSECVGCPPEMGCLYEGCPYYEVNILVCDGCNDEECSDLYELNGEWLCVDCVEDKLESVFDEDSFERFYIYDGELLTLDEVLALLPHMSESDLDWYED